MPADLATHAAQRQLLPERYDYDHADQLLARHQVAQGRYSAAGLLFSKLPSAARESAVDARAFLAKLRHEAEVAEGAYRDYQALHQRS